MPVKCCAGRKCRNNYIPINNVVCGVLDASYKYSLQAMLNVSLCIFILIVYVIYSVQVNSLPVENFTESIDDDNSISAATWSKVVAPIHERGAASTSTIKLSSECETEEKISIGMWRHQTSR